MLFRSAKRELFDSGMIVWSLYVCSGPLYLRSHIYWKVMKMMVQRNQMWRH